MKQAENFTGFYIEKVDLIDQVQTEAEAQKRVAELNADNHDDCVYKYSTAVPKKQITLFTRMQEFEEFVNRDNVDVIMIDLKVVPQDIQFQESFAAIVYYKTK